MQYSIVTSTVDLTTYIYSGDVDPLTLSTTDTYSVVSNASNTYPNANGNTHAYTYSDSDRNADSDANTDTNAYTRPRRRSRLSLPMRQSMSGETATFSVTATGTAPLQYQWRKNGVNISGATSSSYTTPPAVAADNGSPFSVVVSNGGGSVTSHSATLTVRIPPTITTQPANKTVKVGQTAKFTVTATGTTPLHYQWMKNGANITGATNGSYTTPPTTAAGQRCAFAP